MKKIDGLKLIVEGDLDILYHTTSLRGLERILESEKIVSKGDYVSLSEIPFITDISQRDVSIAFNAFFIKDQIEQVLYTEEWFDSHHDQASYVAGEGWREQFVVPDECYDDEGWEDEECYDTAYREAELDSFLWKAGEREWVSKDREIIFDQDIIVEILVRNNQHKIMVEDILMDMDLSIPVRIWK